MQVYLKQSCCCSVGAAGSGHEEVQSVLRVLIYSLADLRHRAYKSVIQSSPVVQNWIVLSIKPPDQITPRAHSRALTRPCEVTPEIRIIRISTSVCFEVEGVTWVYFIDQLLYWHSESREELFVEVRTHSSGAELWTPWFHGFPVFLFIHYYVFIWTIRLLLLAHRRSKCSSLLQWIGRYSILQALGGVCAEILHWIEWTSLKPWQRLISWGWEWLQGFALDSTDPHARLHLFSERPEKMQCKLVEYNLNILLLVCLTSVWAESIFNEVRPDIHGSACLLIPAMIKICI